MTETPERRALARILKGMTQAELARVAGVSAQHVCDVVAGRRAMRDRLLRALGFEKVTVIRRIRP